MITRVSVLTVDGKRTIDFSGVINGDNCMVRCKIVKVEVLYLQ